MIKSTFTFIPGIGEKTEQHFWRKGILTWNDLKKVRYLSASNGTRAKIIRDYLQKAKDALRKSSSSFLNQTVFLDIETTGLSLYYDVITLVGTFDGRTYRVFVKDNNLGDIVHHLRDYQILVTFNGKLFDVPFIKKQFSRAQIPPVHIDLRFVLQGLGITGPLKQTEKKLGIERQADVQRIDGRQAAVLWSRFVKGEDDAIRKLVMYNMSDTANLKNLMDYCYARKIETGVLAAMKVNQTQRRLFERAEKKGLDFYPLSASYVLPKVSVHRSNRSLRIRTARKLLASVSRNRIKRTVLKIDRLVGKINRRKYRAVAVGIDLSGSEDRASGVCVLEGRKACLSMVGSDKEIIYKTVRARPSIISIDSPLSLMTRVNAGNTESLGNARGF